MFCQNLDSAKAPFQLLPISTSELKIINQVSIDLKTPREEPRKSEPQLPALQLGGQPELTQRRQSTSNKVLKCMAQAVHMLQCQGHVWESKDGNQGLSLPSHTILGRGRTELLRLSLKCTPPWRMACFFLWKQTSWHWKLNKFHFREGKQRIISCFGQKVSSFRCSFLIENYSHPLWKIYYFKGSLFLISLNP